MTFFKIVLLLSTYLQFVKQRFGHFNQIIVESTPVYQIKSEWVQLLYFGYCANYMYIYNQIIHIKITFVSTSNLQS